MAYQLSDLAEMSATVTLTKAKGADGDKKGGEYVSPFSSGEVLPVEITAQEIKQTKNGFLQLELARSIIRDDGSTVRAGRVWINLPVFTSEMASKMTNEDLAKKVDAFGKRLHDVLRAADPEQFSIYKEIDRSTKPWSYIAHNGEVLSQEDKEARAELIGAELVNAAKAIVTGQMSLVGKRLYMQETPSKDGNNTYLNCFAEPPSNG